MKELKKIAEETKKQLNLKYDLASVKFLAEFIEQNEANIEKDNWNKLINSYGAFWGECIIENYGGIWKKDANGTIGIHFEDKGIVYPFLVVKEQFENLENNETGYQFSIYSFYCAIPKVFGLEKKKKWRILRMKKHC